ncbi:retrovirus-related pol polyprotein from transposon TNT 1-94 [Tanacetum coccineum]
MDLCGPMRVESINRKKYILVIVDDYSLYTWTRFLRTKDKTPKVLTEFLKMIQCNLQAQVITVRSDKGTKFLNKTLHAYFKEESIEHQTSTPQTPKQNGVSKGYRVYNKRTRLIVKSIHVNFDEIKELSKASDYDNSGLVPQLQKTSDHNSLELEIQPHSNEPSSSKLVPNVSPLANTTAPSLQELDFLFSPLFEEYFTAGNLSVSKSSIFSDNSTQPDTQPSANVQTIIEPITLTITVTVEENNIDIQAKIQAEDAQIDENEFYNIFSTSVHEEEDSSTR